jgi:hypothetical protein
MNSKYRREREREIKIMDYLGLRPLASKRDYQYFRQIKNVHKPYETQFFILFEMH